MDEEKKDEITFLQKKRKIPEESNEEDFFDKIVSEKKKNVEEENPIESLLDKEMNLEKEDVIEKDKSDEKNNLSKKIQKLNN